jgi:hypothetical protein
MLPFLLLLLCSLFTKQLVLSHAVPLQLPVGDHHVHHISDSSDIDANLDSDAEWDDLSVPNAEHPFPNLMAIYLSDVEDSDGFSSDDTGSSGSDGEEFIILSDSDEDEDEDLIMPEYTAPRFSDPNAFESLLIEAVTARRFPIFKMLINSFKDVPQWLVSTLIMSQVNERLDPGWTRLRRLLCTLPRGSIDKIILGGKSLLAHAAGMNTCNGLRLLQILLEEFNANPNAIFLSSQNTWHSAIFYCNSHESCAALAAAGANVHFMERTLYGARTGSALHYAILNNNIHRLLPLLFDARVNVELRNDNGQRAIDLARQIQNADATNILENFYNCANSHFNAICTVAERVQIEQLTWIAPDPALFLASSELNTLPSVAALLRSALNDNNDVLAEFIMGRPIVRESQQVFLKLLRAALEADCLWATEMLFTIATQHFDAPFATADSQQLLIWAVRANARLTVYGLLLGNHGRFNPNATVHKTDRHGKSYQRPLIDLAPSVEMLELLIECGANVEAHYSDHNGYCAPLFIRAIRRGQTDFVEALLQHLNIDPLFIQRPPFFDSLGNTPKYYAQKSASPDMRHIFGLN